jgi:TPP-dependent pyruvate/acetoin dehydrogenase alpha subunit
MSAATSSKTEKNGGIAVVFYSEASGAPADWLRALSEAAASRLPILFVCQTKLLAKRAEIGTPAFSEQIALHARKCGLPAIPVDGSDLVAVYRVATEAIAHARKGNGATLIECAACRPEIEPIPKMEAYLSRKGLFSQELKREVRAGFSRELDAAVEAAGKGAVSV